MADGEGTGSSGIWAVAMIIIVAMVIGGGYYLVKMSGSPKKVDINVTANH